MIYIEAQSTKFYDTLTVKVHISYNELYGWRIDYKQIPSKDSNKRDIIVCGRDITVTKDEIFSGPMSSLCLQRLCQRIFEHLYHIIN